MSFAKKLNFGIYCLLFFITSCNIINKHETVPVYIHIDKFTLTTDNNTEGANSINVSDAWINIDANPDEIYELPATFPELEIGKHKITVRPGIKINGIAAGRGIYPFYTSYEIDTILLSQSIIQIDPQIKYKDATQFSFIEDFEDPAFELYESKSNSDTTIIQLNDTFIQNNKVGAIFLDNDHDNFLCFTDSFTLPRNGTSIYLEMSYQNNIEFDVGVFSIYNQKTYIPVISIYPYISGRNKIYIDLTNTINSNYATYYKIYFQAIKPSSTINAEIILDDIKLLHF